MQQEKKKYRKFGVWFNGFDVFLRLVLVRFSIWPGTGLKPLNAGIIMRTLFVSSEVVFNTHWQINMWSLYQNVLSFQSWCKYHHMADNFKWLCHDYNLKPVEFLILNRECSVFAWVNRAVEQRQKINSALIIASSASRRFAVICDRFATHSVSDGQTIQSINNNLSSLLGRVLWFVVNVCVWVSLFSVLCMAI